MRRILMLSLVAAAAACGPSRSEVEVDWTFGGFSCVDAGVATIQVDIAGEVLTPNRFSCADASLGANLGTYLAGTYQITITGFDANGVVTHQVTQPLPVRGARKETFAIDVTQVAVTTGSAIITWVFDSGSTTGMTCAQANVDQVTILVDPRPDGTGGVSAGTVACSTLGTDGASVEFIQPGNHSFAILGLRAESNGLHIVYRTHQPPTYFFDAGYITDVSVRAESPP